MCRHLVQEKERRRSALQSGEARMSQNNPQEQGLRLTGRTMAGIHAVSAMPYQEITAMGTEGCTAGNRVVLARFRETALQPSFHRQSRLPIEPCLRVTGKSKLGTRKGSLRLPTEASQPPYQLAPPGGNRHRPFRHGTLQSGEPLRLPAPVTQQAAAFA